MVLTETGQGGVDSFIGNFARDEVKSRPFVHKGGFLSFVSQHAENSSCGVGNTVFISAALLDILLIYYIAILFSFLLNFSANEQINALYCELQHLIQQECWIGGVLLAVV